MTRIYITPNGITGSFEQIPWPISLDLSGPAHTHDVDYSRGGTEEDKQKADLKLRSGLLRLGRKRRWPIKLICKYLAWSRYKAVRLLGKSHFRFDPKGAAEVQFDHSVNKMYIEVN